ncbi:hypothetical protein NUU61_010055 [Penicillium alfredii]|uniref:Uncharacterized protein n=1 Tax=Penicillium alfredii TaxID=1506179 RepID=A0A9W9EHE9_9EURO|nr:uncharacterized protein NUU61_010055 [Penicillium alfredii]KAJ5081791.1 hypothetical protein NUU61_010055 [Penicillium alfredii]
MPDTPSRSGQTSAVAGGSSAVPTPANNVNGPERNIDSQGKEDVDASNQPSNFKTTTGQFQGLHDQKAHADDKYNTREYHATQDIKQTTVNGEPTCATEDHSFMGEQPGGNDTLPGWEKLKNIFGK